MEIIFDREYLQGKINLLKGITKHKTLMTICRSVMLDLEGKKISATDLEVSAITGFANTADENRRLVIPAGILSDILGSLTGQDVRIRCDDGNVLKIEQDRVEIGLALADPEDFPDIQTLNDQETFSLPAKDILRGIGKVLYAVSMDETRRILTGVLIQIKDGEFRMCATDGFRIALLKKDIGDITDSPQIVIPGRNMRLLKDILDENANVGVIINENRVQFMTSMVTVIFRTLQEAYPDYENVLSSNRGYNIAFAKRVPFLECLNRMAPIATKTDPVRLARSGDDGLTVRIESEKGYAQETIDCEFKNAADFDFTFNLKFLLDAAEHIESDQLIMRYPDTYGAVVLDSADYICGIMPIRSDKTPIEKQADQMKEDGGEGDGE